jgi:FdhD protein
LENKISKPCISGRKIKIKRITSSPEVIELDDTIPAELLLTIILNGNPLSIISCSPENIIELVIGHLVNNGYIPDRNAINLLKICEQEMKSTIKKNEFMAKVEVFTIADSGKPGNQADFKYISSACGSIDDFVLNKQLQKNKGNIKIKPAIINSLNSENLKKQKYKNRFGGLHSAALFDSDGNLISLYEDIGRHNCIDKIAGFLQTGKINPENKLLFTTGRLSLDVIYKAGRMSVPVIITNSSVTYSAAILAKKLGITAIGYARGGRFNIYSCPGRIAG